MKLKEFLKKKRNDAGLSQKELAKKLGYTTAQFVSNWERSISRPPIDSVPKLAELLGVQPWEIYQKCYDLDCEHLRKKYKNLF